MRWRCKPRGCCVASRPTYLPRRCCSSSTGVRWRPFADVSIWQSFVRRRSAMRKIVLTEWTSLDGYTSGPNNDMSFVGRYFNDEMGRYEGTIVDTADTLLLGRVTYDSFAGSWPHVPDNP